VCVCVCVCVRVCVCMHIYIHSRVQITCREISEAEARCLIRSLLEKSHSKRDV
jgi:hypothetical protein